MLRNCSQQLVKRGATRKTRPQSQRSKKNLWIGLHPMSPLPWICIQWKLRRKSWISLIYHLHLSFSLTRLTKCHWEVVRPIWELGLARVSSSALTPPAQPHHWSIKLSYPQNYTLNLRHHLTFCRKNLCPQNPPPIVPSQIRLPLPEFPQSQPSSQSLYTSRYLQEIDGLLTPHSMTTFRRLMKMTVI